MKKLLWSIPFVFLFLGIGWLGLMSFINTRTARLTVQAAGSVDQVLIFRSGDPVNPVASIETQGKDITRVVDLHTAEGFSLFFQSRPAQYYFTTRQGDQVYQGRNICCETGLFPSGGVLTINGLSNWQFTDR